MKKRRSNIKEVREAYDEYDFHTAFSKIHKFCTSDLSAKYLDVVKDRLYTLNSKNVLRKSIQSTMYDILFVLVRLLAPILAFTSEEIYSYMPKKDNKVSARAKRSKKKVKGRRQ